MATDMAQPLAAQRPLLNLDMVSSFWFDRQGRSGDTGGDPTHSRKNAERVGHERKTACARPSASSAVVGSFVALMEGVAEEARTRGVRQPTFACCAIEANSDRRNWQRYCQAVMVVRERLVELPGSPTG